MSNVAEQTAGEYISKIGFFPVQVAGEGPDGGVDVRVPGKLVAKSNFHKWDVQSFNKFMVLLNPNLLKRLFLALEDLPGMLKVGPMNIKLAYSYLKNDLADSK